MRPSWGYIATHTVGAGLSAAVAAALVYAVAVEAGSALGLDDDHYPVLPPDAYIHSRLELAALFLAGTPVGWQARRFLSLIRERARFEREWASLREQRDDSPVRRRGASRSHGSHATFMRPGARVGVARARSRRQHQHQLRGAADWRASARTG